MTNDELMTMLTNVWNAYTKGKKYGRLEFQVSKRVFDEFKGGLIAHERIVDDGSAHAKALGLPVGEKPEPRLAFRHSFLTVNDKFPPDSYKVTVREYDGNTGD